MKPGGKIALHCQKWNRSRSHLMPLSAKWRAPSGNQNTPHMLSCTDIKQGSACSVFSSKHSSLQRAPVTDTESWGGRELFQMPKTHTELEGGHTALLQDAGHTPGSAWQWLLSAGAWYHTVTADQLGCYDHQVKCPSLVTLNVTKISQFSTKWVSGQVTQCRGRCVYHSGNAAELITEWNSEKQ